MILWLQQNYIEVLGTIFSVLYLLYSVRQKIATWIFGFVSAVFYLIVFYNSYLYASSLLQVYYLFVSVYGYWFWIKSKKDEVHIEQKQLTENQIQYTHITRKQILNLSIISIFSFILLAYILKNYTDSPIPYWDAFTTIGSFAATYLLARKVLENWILWIFVDLVCVFIYLSQGLYPTSVLFLIYTLMAVIGYFNWQKKKIIRISITGPESSGKSTLSQELASYFNTSFVPEFAREYLTSTKSYTYDDVLYIAKKQLKNENKASRKANTYLFCDTDILVTKIWCDYVYKKCHSWIQKKFLSHTYDLYLLCSPDLPWEPDDLRENPIDRDVLFSMYENALKGAQKNYIIIEGNGEARLKQAIEAMNAFALDKFH